MSRKAYKIGFKKDDHLFIMTVTLACYLYPILKNIMGELKDKNLEKRQRRGGS
ncbi:hypothetical protein JOC78_002712 [Bacillus ectoiniformans]|nr:hypothetical protein [Bacillus ectoiniformans]